jgi:hypothetical protein
MRKIMHFPMHLILAIHACIIALFWHNCRCLQAEQAEKYIFRTILKTQKLCYSIS